MGRWEELFADLASRLEGLEAVGREAEVRERARHEIARVPLVARLRAAEGTGISLTVRGAGTLTGRVERVGADWVVLGDVLVPLAAVDVVEGLGGYAAPFGRAEPLGRLGLGHPLRGLALRRIPVSVRLTDGTRLVGTFDRVGSGWADLAEHEPDEPRRAGAVRRTRTLPWPALAAVLPG